MARTEGIARVVYLGGLGDSRRSKHLRSRRETAVALARHGPPLTYFRAGMVVGAPSESYRTLRYLVERLPAMIAPAWLKNAMQPIAIDDTLSYLVQAPSIAGSTGREIQIGGPDVLSYGEMLDRMAAALALRPRPRVPVPFFTPWLSSLWIGLVTPVDAGVASHSSRASPRPRSSPMRRQAGPELRVTVSDEGRGVPAGLRTLAFERFSRASGTRGGAGLGLAIVRAIAHAHRGRADITSDGRSAVTVTLPADPSR